MMAFMGDFTKSFMALLRQLVRHGHNVERGFTPMPADGENPGEFRVTKVAVSPLSYGPVSDHVFSNALLRSIAAARFGSAGDDAEHNEILDAFNDTIGQIRAGLVLIAPRKQVQIDLFAYLLQVFWLDLKQLLYVLRRGRLVPGGLSALRHVTFSAQDFRTGRHWRIAHRSPNNTGIRLPASRHPVRHRPAEPDRPQAARPRPPAAIRYHNTGRRWQSGRAQARAR